LDACDSLRHFSTEVPRRALHSPLLLQSILAYTSKHLRQVTGRDNDSADYYSRSLRLLIPVLDDPEGALNENNLAAIVILRSFEEFSGSKSDHGAHLLGSARLFNLISNYATTSSLGEAARWIVLRQDIYFSLTKSQPLHMDLDDYEYPLAATGMLNTELDSYTNRIVLLFARLLNHVFGSYSNPNPRHWDHLNEQVADWYRGMPQDFSPLWIEPPDPDAGSAFPRIFMAEQGHVVAYQHYCLCSILLAIFDPHLSAPSFETFNQRSEANNIVVKNLRIVIGLAITDPVGMAAKFHASHILQKCGSHLTNEAEREQAIDLLRDVNKTAGWETGHIIDALARQWT
ncbi:hypothetical protein EV356DRAFT_547438, partial [Viridothelium virens]